MTWTIRLRRNAFFHDGTPVDAQQVKASLERSLTSADRDLAPGLNDIVGITAEGSNTIIIRVRTRSTFLLDDLVVAITKRTPENGTIGTGPFVTSSSSVGELVMTAVPNYYGGKSNVDRIVLKSYPALRTAWAAMMRGEVDFLYEVGPEAVEFMQGEASVNMFPFLRSYVYGVVFNSSRREFSDPKVRTALNYAIDRNKLIERALKGHGISATYVGWPHHWAYDASVPTFSYDPSRAVALLEDARVGSQSTKTQTGPPSRFGFSCLVPEGFAVWEKMALIVQRSLSEVGVDMRLESVPFEQFNRSIAARDFDAVMLEFNAGQSPTRPFTFWNSESRRNLWGYKNPDLDRALDGIRRAANDTEYRASFRRLQRASFENPPAIFLALGEVTRAVSTRFEVVAPPGIDVLHTIAEWRPTVQARKAN